MPTFTLDDSAHKILKETRNKLKACGQGADLSDAVRYLNEHQEKDDEHQEKDEYSGWADK